MFLVDNGNGNWLKVEIMEIVDLDVYVRECDGLNGVSVRRGIVKKGMILLF